MIIFLFILALFTLMLFTGIFILYTVYAMYSAAPFVPMSTQTVERVIRLAAPREGQILMDLGSGDGRVLFRAARIPGIRCIGIEINPLLYWWSMATMKMRQIQNVRIYRKNLWQVDLSEVDILTVFFIPPKMGMLKEKVVREMKPGSRVVSYGYRFPDWEYVKEDKKAYVYLN